MNTILLEKFSDAAKSVLPICVIILLLHLTIAPLPLGTLALLATGTVLLLFGMSFFTLGADTATMVMGELIGAKLVESRKLWFIVIISFVLGFAVTAAEPDVHVLTKQVPAVPDMVMVAAIAIGTGIFLVSALLRIFYSIKLSYILIASYLLVFILALFTGSDYLPVAIDSGGVNTGPITVPFILALGAGVSAVRGGKTVEEDSFGLCGLASVGPLVGVLVMGLFFDPTVTGFAFESTSTVSSARELVLLYANGFVTFVQEVIIALLPIVVIFSIYQVTTLKLPKSQLIKIFIGIIYSLVGLTIFLTGVNIGFMPVGLHLGSTIADLPYNWILIPLSTLIGFYVVAAEPAVHVLNKQVEEITTGALSRRMMMAGMSIGVGIALTLAMIRIMFGTNIWYFLLPGYALALLLALIVPPIFTAIAFDSGGVAAGSMAAVFLLPFSRGVSSTLGGNIMTDAFGIVGMVAMMPLVSVQVMGFIYSIKMRRAKELELAPAQSNEVQKDYDTVEF